MLIENPPGATRSKPATVDLSGDIASVSAISVVPLILDLALQLTGMGFAAVARVTEDRWVTCQSLDHVAFGLKPGDELPIESTICNEIRDRREPVIFDDADQDPAYQDHHTPRIYGLKSYISFPIILGDGRFFGTLCAIDTKPAKVRSPVVMGTFQLFADLIGRHLDANDTLRSAQADLVSEQERSELHEQFVAVLGHDLRNPIAALDAGTSRLIRDGWTAQTPLILQLMKSSINRMSGLVNNVLDLARTRLGEGLTLNMSQAPLSETLTHVIEELRIAHPERTIVANLSTKEKIVADHQRLAQLFSNLIGNALTHGADDRPVVVETRSGAGTVSVAVVNGGAAIPPERMGKLFTPFKRGGSHSQGLGLGLYIAAEIADAHGGTITVQSDAAETRFTFQMPVA